MFEAESLHDLLDQVINHDPKPPSHWNPEIPKDLDVLVLKSVAKSKAKRYNSAENFAEDIGRYLAGYAISAKASGHGERIVKKINKNRINATKISP